MCCKAWGPSHLVGAIRESPDHESQKECPSIYWDQEIVQSLWDRLIFALSMSPVIFKRPPVQEDYCLTESTTSTTHFVIMYLWSRRLGQSFLLNNLTSQYQPTFVLQPIPLRPKAVIADSLHSSKMAKYVTGIRPLTFNILLVPLSLPLCPYSMFALLS